MLKTLFPGTSWRLLRIDRWREFRMKKISYFWSLMKKSKTKMVTCLSRIKIGHGSVGRVEEMYIKTGEILVLRFSTAWREMEVTSGDGKWAPLRLGENLRRLETHYSTRIYTCVIVRIKKEMKKGRFINSFLIYAILCIYFRKSDTQ